jgi:hypothetical protein
VRVAGTSTRLIALAGVFAVVSARPVGSHDLKSSDYDVHRVATDQRAADFAAGTYKGTAVDNSPPGVVLAGDRRARSGTYTSREIVADFPFNEVIPSFNVDLPAGTGFVVWLRCRPTGGARWTRYYYAGTFSDAGRPEEVHGVDDHGAFKVDCFQSARTFDRLGYRVRMHSDRKAISPRLVRFSLCYSNTTGDRAIWQSHAPKRKRSETGLCRLDVPFRSQQSEDRAVASRLCSPTSVSMVLAYHGVEVPTRLVAELAYDREHDLYGNWARAIQTAHTLGVSGYVRRFHSLDEAGEVLAEGTPLILSIRAKSGDLPGAPYRETEGHLLVLTGFNEQGDPLVNDPAGKTPGEGQIHYPRAALEKAWLQHGGVAYVFSPRVTDR